MTDNLKVQTEKIQEMLNGLADGKDLKDWTIEDVDLLDGHLWAKLKEVLTEIINKWWGHKEGGNEDAITRAMVILIKVCHC